MDIRKSQRRASTALDVTAYLLSRALPAALREHIDQIRLDVRSLSDGVRGARPKPFADATHGFRASPPLAEVDPLELLPNSVAESIRGVERDLRIVGGRLLFGTHPSPLIVRPKRAPRPAAPAAQRPTTQASFLENRRALTVTRVERETADAVSIYFRPADGRPLQYSPGQFLSFDVDVAGERLRRAYSLASPVLPDEQASPEVHVTVKRVEGGRVSNRLNDAIAEGDEVFAFGPAGSFTVTPNPGTQREIVLIAGGSGITPCMSILHSVLATEPRSRVTLVYGNRRAQDIIFRERLVALRNQYGDRLTVDHVLESPGEDDNAATQGRLDAATIGHRLDALRVDDDVDGYFICGPTPMMDAAREALATRRVPATSIHEERFSRPEGRVAARGSDNAERVRIIHPGGQHSVIVQPGQSLLEAVRAAGDNLPFSCAMGGCGACRVRCTAGTVVMDEPNCLTPAEREAGYILTCVGRPTGQVTLELDS